MFASLTNNNRSSIQRPTICKLHLTFCYACLTSKYYLKEGLFSKTHGSGCIKSTKSVTAVQLLDGVNRITISLEAIRICSIKLHGIVENLVVQAKGSQKKRNIVSQFETRSCLFNYEKTDPPCVSRTRAILFFVFLICWKSVRVD